MNESEIAEYEKAICDAAWNPELLSYLSWFWLGVATTLIFIVAIYAMTGETMDEDK